MHSKGFCGKCCVQREEISRCSDHIKDVLFNSLIFVLHITSSSLLIFYSPKKNTERTHYRHTSEVSQVVVHTTVRKQHCSGVSCDLFAGGGSCLQLAQNAPSVKPDEVRRPVSVLRYRAKSVLSIPARTDLLAEWSLRACACRGAHAPTHAVDPGSVQS